MMKLKISPEDLSNIKESKGNNMLFLQEDELQHERSTMAASDQESSFNPFAMFG